MVTVAKLVNAPGCGSGIRGFKSRRSPHFIEIHLGGFYFVQIKRRNRQIPPFLLNLTSDY